MLIYRIKTWLKYIGHLCTVAQRHQEGGGLAENLPARSVPSLFTFDHETKERLRLTARLYGLSMSQVLRHLVRSHCPSLEEAEKRLLKHPTGVTFLEDPDAKHPPNLEKLASKKDGVRVDYDSVRKWWNADVSVLLNKPKIKAFSPTRKAKVKKRIRDNPAVLDEIREEAHKIGKFYYNATSWGGFDWLFRGEGNVQKFLEGNYREEDMHVDNVPSFWQAPAWFPESWQKKPAYRKMAMAVGCPPEQLRRDK